MQPSLQPEVTSTVPADASAERTASPPVDRRTRRESGVLLTASPEDLRRRSPAATAAAAKTTPPQPRRRGSIGSAASDVSSLPVDVVSAASPPDAQLARVAEEEQSRRVSARPTPQRRRHRTHDEVSIAAASLADDEAEEQDRHPFRRPEILNVSDARKAIETIFRDNDELQELREYTQYLEQQCDQMSQQTKAHTKAEKTLKIITAQANENGVIIIEGPDGQNKIINTYKLREQRLSRFSIDTFGNVVIGLACVFYVLAKSLYHQHLANFVPNVINGMLHLAKDFVQNITPDFLKEERNVAGEKFALWQIGMVGICTLSVALYGAKTLYRLCCDTKYEDVDKGWTGRKDTSYIPSPVSFLLNTVAIPYEIAKATTNCCWSKKIKEQRQEQQLAVASQQSTAK